MKFGVYKYIFKKAVWIIDFNEMITWRGDIREWRSRRVNIKENNGEWKYTGIRGNWHQFEHEEQNIVNGLYTDWLIERELLDG